MKNLGIYDSFLFDEHILISLDKKWIEVFGEIPKFEVKIDSKGKLHLVSTKSIQYKKNIQ